MAPLQHRAFKAMVTTSVVIAVVLGSGLGLNLYLSESDDLVFTNPGNEFGPSQLALMVCVMLLTDSLFLLLALVGLVFIGASILKLSQHEIVSSLVPLPSPFGLRWVETLVRRIHSAIAR